MKAAPPRRAMAAMKTTAQLIGVVVESFWLETVMGFFLIICHNKFRRKLINEQVDWWVSHLLVMKSQIEIMLLAFDFRVSAIGF